MSIDMHPEAKEILDSPINAHFVTTRANGKPHVSFVWLDLTPDGVIHIGTPPWRVKAKNILRDPHVVISIMDTTKGENGLYRHLLIEGNAKVDPDLARGKDFMDNIALKYLGAYGFPIEEDYIVIDIEPTRFTGAGPWHTGPSTPYGTPI